MKTIVISCITLFVLSLQVAVGQHEQNTIRFGASLGYANLQGDLGEGGSVGANFVGEARYYVMDQLAVGGEYNRTLMAFGDGNSPFGVSGYGFSGYYLKGEYYFLNGTFAPYAGLAAGISRLVTPEIQVGNEVVPSEGKTGLALAPRLGIALGNWAVEAGYTFGGRTPETEIQNVASSDKPFNFLTFSLRYSYPIER